MLKCADVLATFYWVAILGMSEFLLEGLPAAIVEYYADLARGREDPEAMLTEPK